MTDFINLAGKKKKKKIHRMNQNTIMIKLNTFL